MDLKDVLVPINVKVDGMKLKDYVSIESADMVDNSKPSTAGASDLAVASGARLSDINFAFNHKKRTFFWTNTKKDVEGVVSIRGNLSSSMGQKVNGGVACVRPFIKVKKSVLEKNGIDFRIQDNSNGFQTVVIDSFLFPQTVVEEPLASELEGAAPTSNSPARIVTFNNAGQTQGSVYEYNNTLYLRFNTTTPDNDSNFANGDKPNGVKTYWFRFEPIVWLLRKDDGNEMSLCAEDGLIGNINYHNMVGKNSNLWQNSLIRSYLNGLNLQQSIKDGNGNPRKATFVNYNFENIGFIDALQMAFDYTRKEASQYNIPKLVPIINPDKKIQRKKVQVSSGIVSSEGKEKTWEDKTIVPSPAAIKPTTTLAEEKKTPLIEKQEENNLSTPEKQEENNLPTPKKQEDNVVDKKEEEKQKEAAENIAKASIPEYDLEDTDSISAPKLEKASEGTDDKDEDNNWEITVSDTPLNTEEQIKFYIEHGKSFMLHGVSGIGKSGRIKDIDPDYVQIQLRDGILPEEVIGKTGFDPVNGKSFWIEPTWYTRIKEVCAKDPNHNHVLFIDEITNVRPYEQSLVFHIVLERSIDGNYGRLPKNCVVVAAGNSPEESEAAYNMPEPLFRRFSGHIYLKLNAQEFLKWAGKPKRDNPKRKNIHPFLAEFIVSRGVLYSKYDKDETTFAIDPRGWEQVSDILYDSKGIIDFNLISNKIGADITRALIDFAQQPRITVEGIVNGTYQKSKIPTNANGKYALILSLVNANYEQFIIVRKFIEKNLGYEYMEVYDSLWAQQDDEKALFVSRLREGDGLDRQM